MYLFSIKDLNSILQEQALSFSFIRLENNRIYESIMSKFLIFLASIDKYFPNFDSMYSKD